MAIYKIGVAKGFCMASVGMSALLYLVGCGQRDTTDDMAELRGLVTYQEQFALPGSARLEVELKDVTKAKATSEILGRTVVENAGQKPIGFIIVYNASKFEQGHIYAVSATLYDGRQKLFTTEKTYPVDLENLKGLLNIELQKAN